MDYTIGLSVKNESQDEIELNYEKYAYKVYNEIEWSHKEKCINVDFESDIPFLPKTNLEKIVRNNKDGLIDLLVAHKFAKMNKSSFVFGEEFKTIMERCKEDILKYQFIKTLKYFSNFNFFVFNVKNLGHINMSDFLPLQIRIEDRKSIVRGNMQIRFFESFTVPIEVYDTVDDTIKQINTVINAIIPGLQLKLIKIGTELSKENTEDINLQILSCRYGKNFRLNMNLRG